MQRSMKRTAILHAEWLELRHSEDIHMNKFVSPNIYSYHLHLAKGGSLKANA